LIPAENLNEIQQEKIKRTTTKSVTVVVQFSKESFVNVNKKNEKVEDFLKNYGQSSPISFRPTTAFFASSDFGQICITLQ